MRALIPVLAAIAATFSVAGPVVTATPPTTDSELYDVSPAAVEYAHAFGVTEAEAQRRLEAQTVIGDMEQVLESTFPDTWAGLWVEHQPYRIVIAATDFTGIRSVLSHFDVPAPVEFQYADLTLQQLIDAHQRLRAVLNHETARSEIDIHRNQLVVYALVGTEYNATLSAIGIPADHIQVQILSAFPKLTTTIYGGGTVSTCTSGFSVKKTISGSVWKGGHNCRALFE